MNTKVYKVITHSELCTSPFRKSKAAPLTSPQIAFFLLVCFLCSPLADANNIIVSFKIMIIRRYSSMFVKV